MRISGDWETLQSVTQKTEDELDDLFKILAQPVMLDPVTFKPEKIGGPLGFEWKDDGLITKVHGTAEQPAGQHWTTMIDFSGEEVPHASVFTDMMIDKVNGV